MLISTDWKLIKARPGKRIYAKVEGEKVVIREEFDDDGSLEQAASSREVTPTMHGSELRHQAVIPPSVMNRAIGEGWINDDKAWKRWMNDIDNNKLRVAGGTV